MITIPFAWRFRTALALLCTVAGCAETTGGATYARYGARFARSEHPSSTEASRQNERALSAPVLDVAAYIRAVLRRNPGIESARQGWRAALARVRQAGAFEDPMLDVGLAPLSIASPNARFGYEVGISQKVPWFGKRALEVSASAAEAEATRSDYESVKRDLALTALTLYEQYFVAERSLAINAQHVELMRSLQEAVMAELVTGRGSSADALQADSELAHMEHDTLVLRSQRDVLVAQMNELLHRAPELPLPPPPEELTLDGQLGVAPEGLEDQALKERSDIAAARYRAQAEQARADRAAREQYPDLTVSTSYNSMWDTPEHLWMVGLGLDLPIQTGRRDGALDEAKAARAALESEAARLGDAARTQVFTALKQLEASRHLLELYEQRLTPLAGQRVAAARAGFVSSQSSFVSVIDAEKELRGVELDYQLARAACHHHYAELERALGRIPGLAGQELDQ